MAGLAAHAAGAKTALAGTGASAAAGAWKAATGAASAGGALGGLLGTLGGLLGGWLGTWVPAQAASTSRERDAFLRAGWRMLLVSVVFIAALIGLILAFAGKPSYVIAWSTWMVAFSAYIAIECVRLAREIKRIRVEQDPTDLPNLTALRAGWTAVAERFGNRVYRSEATLLGFPLIDINLSAPLPPQRVTPGDSTAPDNARRIARGWIAIGDDARGILLAIGSTALGLIALGGRAFGVVSCGGLALGAVAFGGVGLGLLGIGGLGVGVYAVGGGAVGWRAAGGLAIGWDMACGGGAFAQRAAIGGVAIARDYAVGRRGPRPPRQRRCSPRFFLGSTVHAIRVYVDGTATGSQAIRRRRREMGHRSNAGTTCSVRARKWLDRNDSPHPWSGKRGATGALQDRRRSRPPGTIRSGPLGGARLRHCSGRRPTGGHCRCLLPTLPRRMQRTDRRPLYGGRDRFSQAGP